jgi:hypothetical protein
MFDHNGLDTGERVMPIGSAHLGSASRVRY